MFMGKSPVQWLAYSTHDWKVVGSNLIQYYTRWKWCQSHARIDSCTQSWYMHSIIEKKRTLRSGTSKNDATPLED